MSDGEQPQPPEGMRACAVCGRPFVPNRLKTTYCTAICRQKASLERARRRAKERED
jgi:hypothetical protein